MGLLGRRRPLLRGAVVGGAAYQIGKHRARKQAEEEQATQDDEQESQSASSQASTGSDENMNKLQELKKMHDSGVLTDDEFATAKEKVLANL